MKLSSYLRDNFIKFVMYIVAEILVFSVLIAFKVDMAVGLSIAGILTVFGLALLFYDFARKRKFYADMTRILERLDKKYLLVEMLPRPNFLEGRLFFEALAETNKAAAEEVGDYRRQTKDFREYIELWVHEIKTPLTGLNLKLRGGARAEKIYLSEMENYIDQALYYSKIDATEQDYIVKQVDLAKIVNNVVRRNKDSLIAGGVKVRAEELNHAVHSDAKWLEFVVNQVVSNAIKYRSDQPELVITAAKTKSGVTLRLRDNGIGIRQSELKRVFRKGFTGSNDRKTKASTGMGLYIAHELCRGLGHEIAIDSKVGEYTEVEIRFDGHDFFLTKS